MELIWPFKEYVATLNKNQTTGEYDVFWKKIKDFENGGSFSFLNSLNAKETNPLEILDLIKEEHNILIEGDNLFALKTLADVFHNANQEDKIKLVYIDPPYNTGNKINQYYDDYKHFEWLSMIYHRTQLIHKILREDGLIMVQLDDKEFSHMDIILSEIFGRKNKLKTLIWRRRQSQANLKKTISIIHDYIIIYAKNKKIVDTSKIPSGIWANTKKYGYNQLASNEIRDYFGDKRIFDTPKPELLLYHLIKSTTSKNDKILDCFAGSGTTLAVAQKIGRRWIGIEKNATSVDLIKKRIQIINDGKIKTKVDKYRHSEELLTKIPLTIKIKEMEYKKMNFSNSIPVKNTNICTKKRLEMFFSENNIYEETKKIKIAFENRINRQKKPINSIIFNTPILIKLQNYDYDRKKTDVQYLYLFEQILKKCPDKLSHYGFISVIVYEKYFSIMKLWLDEYFGEENFIGTFIHRKTSKNSDNIKNKNCINLEYLENDFDYILMYAKDLEKMNFHKLPPNDKLYFNPDNDPRGPWLSHPIVASKKSNNKEFTYKFKDGREITRKWRYPESSIKKLENENRIHYTQPKKGVGVPRVKKFFSERMKEFNESGKRGTTPNSLLLEPEEYGNLDDCINFNKTKKTNNNILVLGNKKLFSFLEQITLGKNEKKIQSFVIFN